MEVKLPIRILSRAARVACAAMLVLIFALACSKQSPDKIRAISVSVDSLLRAGDTVAAMVLGRNLIDLPNASSSSKDVSMFQMLNQLAEINARAGRYRDAESLYEHLLSQSQGDDSVSRSREIAVMQELGLVCFDQGNDARAKSLLDSALIFREQLYGRNHWRYGLGLDALALREMRALEWTKAEEHLRASSVLYRGSGAAGDSLLAKCLTNLATVRAELGDAEGEQAAITEVIELLTHVNNLSPVARAYIHNALSIAFDRKGDLEEGLRHQQLAAELLSEFYGSQSPISLLTRANLLVSFYSLDKMDDLKKLLDHLHDDIGTISTETIALADACRITGSLYLNIGDLDRAAELLNRARAIYTLKAKPASRDKADCCMALAQLEQKRGNTSASLAFADEMLAIARLNFREMFDNLAESEALSYSRQLRDASDFFLSLHRELGDSVFARSVDFSQTVMSSKEIVTDGLLIRSRILRELDSHNALPLLDSLAELRKTLSVLYSGGRSDEAMRKSLANTVSTIEKQQRKLAELSGVYKEGTASPQVTINDICSALPDSAVLIEYYKYTHTDQQDQRFTKYAAIVVKRAGLVANLDLGAAEPIEAAARNLTDDLGAPQMLDRERTSRLTAKLQALVWDRIPPLIDSPKLILISPDGALNGVAFQAFKSKDDQFLVEHSAVHYLSSARDVLNWADESTETAMPLMLTFADPDFSQTRSSTRLAELPATRHEVEQVTRSWKAAHSGNIKSYFGSEAVSAVLISDAPRAQMLYIASHGESGVLDSSDVHELLLSQQSLLLAGDSTTGDHGVITAAEISQLNLANTKLVVLSACETASGLQIEGEGTLNLRRAFQLAGAHSVVSTLWSVDDSSTAELMSSLFTDRDLSLPAALRNATVLRIEELRMQNDPLRDHPYRWAGVCSSGRLKM